MDLREYVEQLYAAEQKSDVNRYVEKNIRLWPLFRLQAIAMFRSEKDYHAKKERKPALSDSLKDKLLNPYYSRKFLKEFRAHLRQQLEGKPVDVMLYSKAAAYTDKVDGKVYNRFIDPFFEKLHAKYKTLKIELCENETVPQNRLYDSVCINQHAFRSHFFYKYKNDPALKISASDAFAELKELTGLSFEGEKIDSAFREIVYYRELFREIFRFQQSRLAFVKCYYEHDAFGLMLASKESGIKTVDIQHGKQGVFHPMYSHFSKIPEGGYNLLPDYFWNWGKESAENIGRWMNRKDLHEPVVGGNLWLGKWKYGEVYKAGHEEEEKFLQSLKTYERVVLYSMQPLDNELIIPVELKKAIGSSPAGWIWLLRRHPFQKISATEIRALAGETKAAVEVDFASSVPLYHLLKSITNHITLWSSCGFEASEFDKPTIIAHPFGKKAYEAQISDGIFTYAENAAEIVGQIGQQQITKKNNYIETGENISREAFATIGVPV
jgi:hypothetical protein